MPARNLEMAILVLANLLLSSAAWAQGDRSGTQSPAAEGTTAIQSPNSSPETDARGIPVVSDPAAAPAGYNQPSSPMSTTSAPGMAGPRTVYATPPCTSSVTDRCIQLYESGRVGARLPTCPGHPSCRRRPRN